MPYYTFKDPEILAIVDKNFENRQAVLNEYIQFAQEMGCTSFYASNNLINGIELCSIGINEDKAHTIDLTKWRNTKDIKKGHIRLLPRKSNKIFYSEYEAKFPKSTFSYAPLLQLVLKHKYQPIKGSEITLHHKPNHYFVVESIGFELTSDMKEILHSEFIKLTNQ